MGAMKEHLLDQIMLVNDYTEHRFGFGPLWDSHCGDQKLLRRAIRLAKKNGYEPGLIL